MRTICYLTCNVVRLLRLIHYCLAVIDKLGYLTEPVFSSLKDFIEHTAQNAIQTDEFNNKLTDGWKSVCKEEGQQQRH